MVRRTRSSKTRTQTKGNGEKVVTKIETKKVFHDDGRIITTVTTTTTTYDENMNQLNQTTNEDVDEFIPKLEEILVLETSKEFKDSALEVHNKYRLKHGVKELKWGKKCFEHAQNWANHLLTEEGKMKHSTTEGFGENLYYCSGKKLGDAELAQSAVESWYSEIENYNFKTGKRIDSNGPKIGHFTQCVWKGSKLLGMAMAKKANICFVVANYSPPGNYVGEYTTHVLPLS